MGGEWLHICLGDVCAKIGSGATPRGGNSVYLDAGDIALIRSQNVHNDGFRREGLTYITEKHADELMNVEIHPGDVLLNITGDSVARCCQVPDDILPARVNQHVAIIRPDPAKLDAQFLRYALVTPTMQEQLFAWAAAGATRNALTKKMIETLEVTTPADITEQRAIAHILGTLDDKIELNRRMNETLEAIARAIFKSWFVDFDPVRAKAEGRDTGLSADVAALFPDGFEDSELGEIPRGWRVTPFADTVDIFSGGTPRTSEPRFWDGDIYWFTVRDTPPSGDIFVVATERRITEAGVIESATQILPLGTTIISARGTVGNVTLVGVPMAMNQTCYGLRGSSGCANYTYFATRNLISTFRQYTHGTVFDTITRETLRTIPVVEPLVTLQHAFERLVDPILRRVLTNVHQSVTVMSIRDVLLPKLMSGELRVTEAERFLTSAPV